VSLFQLADCRIASGDVAFRPTASVNRRAILPPRSASKRAPSERVVPGSAQEGPTPGAKRLSAQRSGGGGRFLPTGGNPRGWGVRGARVFQPGSHLRSRNSTTRHLLDLHDIFRSDAGSPRRHGLGGDAKTEPSARNERLTTAIGPSAPALGPRCLPREPIWKGVQPTFRPRTRMDNE
jgi:hypothetical protein